ncbi:MAG: DUF3795 domain-containing protein [Desulfobacteraceae bacterium]|nr:DUF3795 domain-containing protein [Desulfobacteraceae bacterium]
MREIATSVEMIAMCGLYCGACPRFLKKKCNGCKENEKSSWRKLRACCLDKNIASCADCNEFTDVMACKKYNNFMAKIFGFIFNSNRSACIVKIKEVGYDEFAIQMSSNRQMTFKRK